MSSFFIPISLLLNVLLVIAGFAVAPSKLIGGVIGGGLFLFFTLANIVFYRRQEVRRRVGPWLHYAFLVAFVLPMLAWRALNWETPFEEANFIFLDGPAFHSWSTQYFKLLFLICCFEEFWIAWRKRQTDASH